MFHGSQQTTLFGQLSFPVGGSLHAHSPISRSQSLGVEQLVIAVGEFYARDVKFESLRHRRFAGTHLSQRGL